MNPFNTYYTFFDIWEDNSYTIAHLRKIVHPAFEATFNLLLLFTINILKTNYYYFYLKK